MTMARSIPAIALLFIIIAAAIGCASKEVKPAKPRTVRLEEFVSPNVQAERPIAQPSSRASSTEPPSASPVETAPATQADRVAVKDLDPGTVVVIDRVIGQVSGRPIFADAILEPLAEMLRAYGQ